MRGKSRMSKLIAFHVNIVSFLNFKLTISILIYTITNISNFQCQHLTDNAAMLFQSKIYLSHLQST